MIGYAIQQSQTAQPLTFLMVLTSDHITGATGLSPTVTISKNGAAFGSPSGAVTEIANGWYKVAGNATDSGTLGPLLLHATAGTADDVDVSFNVVAYDPQTAYTTGAMRGTDSAALATALATAQTDLDTITGSDGVTLATAQANYAPATAAAVAALNDVAATDIVSGGAITTSAGAVSTVTTVGTTTTNTDMRGTDSAALATSLATAQTDLDTLTGTDGVTLATAQANYAPATAAAVAALNDVAATDIVSGGAITTSGGAVSTVTTVTTTTTNTDMRGTDSAALATALATAQTDLDTLTGTDGATLATAQANYAPATAAAMTTAQADLDLLTGADGALLATTQTTGWPANLAASAGQIIKATVDTVTNTHTPTTTEFQADDVTEATADHYNGRIVIFTSGGLAGQATDITDYVAAGGIGQFTVTALTEAPSNNDTFVIV